MLDFETFTASDPRPCLLLDMNGTISARNDAALQAIPAAFPGVELNSLLASTASFRGYLAECAETRGPLPASLVLRNDDGPPAKWHCDGGRVDLAGSAKIVLRLVAEVPQTATFEYQRNEDAERSEAHLAAIVLSSSDAIISKTLTGHVMSWNTGAQRMFGYTAEEMVGQSITRLLPTARLAEEANILAQLSAGHIIDHFETVRVTKDGRKLDVSVTISPVKSRSGEIVAASKVVRNISDQKARERLIETLIQEVNHRSKNMLGLVLAIARQTANASPDQFLPNFSDRVRALAASQDLLVKNHWSGTALGALVKAQLAHFDAATGTRIRSCGTPVVLSASAAQSVGMALHELATNALKYGALANDVGTVNIEWGRECKGPRDEFWMTWQESGGPPVVEPTRRGFGTTVISRLLTTSLGGNVEVRYAVTGFSWTLRCPAANVLDLSAV